MLTDSGQTLYSLAFDATTQTGRSNSLLEEAAAQVSAYFTGQRRSFDLPLSPDASAFQQMVWKELCRIPFGQQISYGVLSGRLNHPLAIRAIAAANGKNPLPVVIPCHRVVGSNGKLVGYSGGLWRKKFLLDLEGNPMF